MTRSTGDRLYRACERCRKRKSKCDLGRIGVRGKPPCAECFRTGYDCTLAGSRRGGNYSHLRKRKNGNIQRAESSTSRLPTTRGSPPAITDRVGAEAFGRDEQDDETMCAELKNPFDALQILAKAAATDHGSSDHNNGLPSLSKLPLDLSEDRDDLGDGTLHLANSDQRPIGAAAGLNRGMEDYELVTNGTLDIEIISELLRNYEEKYHAFVPLVPKHVLAPLNIHQSMIDERFILTAILTIASKDDACLETIHRNCWVYMKKLLLEVLLGLPSAQRIGTVEGLLLLSEWVPYIQFEENSSHGIQRRIFGCTEDSAAWSLVGQAVRQAYLLRLDRTSFRREDSKEPKERLDRKRLAWTFVYLADRQISVRMGQSFWSRGPSLSTKFTAVDFPTLQPNSSTEEDYAFVLQATIELTQLLHNVHDILYTSKSRTREIMHTGDYSRYLDDFMTSLAAWDRIWGPLNVSPKVKSTLRLMYEYLCLYVNAFSLQAVISRSPCLKQDAASDSKELQPLFPRGVMASPDGCFIFEAIRAAKAILNNILGMDPVAHIRYLPSRFYLYGIYSAVFLWRANIFGALNTADENERVVELVRGFMTALENAASNEYHIAQRFSRLLKSLWLPSLGQTCANARTIQMQIDSNAECTTSTPAMNSPRASEVPQSTDPELHGFILETMSLDPFCGSFSGLGADIFGFGPEDGFSFHGSGSSYL